MECICNKYFRILLVKYGVKIFCRASFLIKRTQGGCVDNKIKAARGEEYCVFLGLALLILFLKHREIESK